jgi:hypothetical protein
MLQLLKVRRGRNAAIAAIGPLLEGSRYRLDGIPDSVFAEPYMLGFLSVLISAAAKHAVPSADPQSLGLIQAETLSRLTGISADLFGENICYLSGTRHKDFVDGCMNALAFAAALDGRGTQATVADPAAFPGQLLDDGSLRVRAGDAVAGSAHELWQQYFEARIDVATTQVRRDPF